MQVNSKVWLFRAIMLCIPFLFFILFELSLRLLSITPPTPLFIDNPAHADYQLPRPDVLTRYFPPQSGAPNVTLEANFLLKQKPANGFRIFVQGGSTAAGYPYGLGASLAGMLDHRLKASLPGRYVEVINTALSAVNSHTLLDLADEIIAQQPDAVVIYAGHNEYLGVLGVGSNFTLGEQYWLTRAMLWLKDLHTYQLLQRVIYALNPPTNQSSNEQSRRTVMSQVAKHQSIEKDSALYAAGLEQFSSNMQRLIARYQAAGIPVFISTIASNLRDQAPFASQPVPNEFSQVKATVTAPQALITLATQWQDSTSADLHYQLAKAFEATADMQRAKHHYLLAKEHDLLRFRAPEAINAIIKSLAQESGVYLVDALAALEQRSKDQIIGRNLMLEHLHPNVPGYFVIADAVYQSMSQSGLFRPWQTIDTTTAWQRRPLLPAEEYFGFASIITLMADYPFTDSPKPVALPPPNDWQQTLGLQQFRKQISWLTMAQQSAQRYQAETNLNMLVKTSQLIADALPHDPIANAKAAELLVQQQRTTEALFYALRAQRAGDVSPSTLRLIETLSN
ncbi:SGNH/GDSL hydrolase family protein [Alteromonas flava]|uniref:SGNH/GDSL hydrolase family protein n=1 Tax=Alteromonas flava TaxID=2048003 RepID=UPI000C2949A3|nr:GDSL-type esterase/lipase family protein [Alteromonas flava]